MKNKHNEEIILEWNLTNVKDPDFAKYMKEICEIGVQSYVPIEVAFLKSNLDKSFHKEYCKPLERLFSKGPKANDWLIFKQALARSDWDTVEEKMKLIIEEFYLMDYSKFNANDKHLFVINRDKNTNKIQSFAMFYITPEYPKGKVKMTHLGVVPEKRGQGIGRSLIFSVLDIIPGTKEIFLCTRPTNETAIKVYTACGFTIDKDPPSEPHIKNPEQWIYLNYKVS